MNTQAAQRGLVVIVLLALTSLAGSVLLGVHSFRNTAGVHKRALFLKSDLLNARDALISYTTHYPYLYGARGAGVGHFPCPDTDGITNSAGSVWFPRLGPNPPCGSQPRAQGWLPAHISFPNHRYSFTNRLNEPVLYRVSGRFINNPINRTVNPDVILNAQFAYTPFVELHQKLSHNEQTYLSKVKVAITPAMLLLSTKPSVASWFVRRLSLNASIRCMKSFVLSIDNEHEQSDVPTIFPRFENSRQNYWCRQFYEIAKHCEKSIRVPTILLMKNGEGQSSDISESVKVHSQFIIFLIADEFPPDYDCEKSPASQLFIEGALAKSHWFVRNHWERWVQLMVEDDCLQEPIVNCEFKKFTRSYEKVSPIVVHWGFE